MQLIVGVSSNYSIYVILGLLYCSAFRLWVRDIDLESSCACDGFFDTWRTLFAIIFWNGFLFLTNGTSFFFF